MAFEPQSPAYERNRAEAKARVSKIKTLISEGNFGDDFAEAMTNFANLVNDACTLGEAMKAVPETKSETRRVIGIAEGHIDELVTIAGMPTETLRKAAYDECTREFKKAFPDPETIRASQTKMVRRMRKDGGDAAVILVPPAMRDKRSRVFDRPSHNC